MRGRTTLRFSLGVISRSAGTREWNDLVVENFEARSQTDPSHQGAFEELNPSGQIARELRTQFPRLLAEQLNSALTLPVTMRSSSQSTTVASCSADASEQQRIAQCANSAEAAALLQQGSGFWHLYPHLQRIS
jgi:hypothetical protein